MPFTQSLHKMATRNEGLLELKQKAQQYYQQNGVPQKIEEVLNSMFYDDPNDVYGHLVSVLYLYPMPHIITHEISLHMFSAVT